MQTRTFGLDEANRLVPHLTRTFETLRALVMRTRATKEQTTLL
jgi:hypothetical protein